MTTVHNKSDTQPSIDQIFYKNPKIHIQYKYPKGVIGFVELLNPHFRMVNCSEGKIWLNGKRLHTQRAMQLRPFFADPFGWGCVNENAKATALEICLQLFPKEAHALKLYTPFLHTFVKNWEGYRGNVTIDITDFLQHNHIRCGDNVDTYYYVDGSKSVHEVDIYRDSTTNTYHAYVEDKEIVQGSLSEIKDEICCRLARHVLRK